MNRPERCRRNHPEHGWLWFDTLDPGRGAPPILWLHSYDDRGDGSNAGLNVLARGDGLPRELLRAGEGSPLADADIFPYAVGAPQSADMPWKLSRLRNALFDVCRAADAERAVVAGFGFGADAAWRLAADQPEMVAAVVAIAGRADVGAGLSTAQMRAIGDLPAWIAYHVADNHEQRRRPLRIGTGPAQHLVRYDAPRREPFAQVHPMLARDACVDPALWEWMWDLIT